MMQSEKRKMIQTYDSMGLMRLKEWLIHRAEIEGISPEASSMRFYRGMYPSIRRLRVNKRVVYVKETSDA